VTTPHPRRFYSVRRRVLAILRGEDLPLPPHAESADQGKGTPMNTTEPTNPIDTPGVISALGQAIASQANRLANETARPTLVNPAWLRILAEGIKGDLDRLDDVLDAVLTQQDAEGDNTDGQ
jgi:hypothetical protein